MTRLFYVLSEQGLLNPELEAAPADAIVLPMTEDLGFAAETATLLRESGIRTQLYTEEKKFKQKLSYASKLGIPFAVIIGEDEAKSGLVSLKDMRRGEQISCAPAEAAEKIKAALAESAGARLIKEK